MSSDLSMEEVIKGGDRPARELTNELLPHLEAVANLHYLLDRHVEHPEKLKQLRTIEDEAFNAMLQRVLSHL